ncbi:DUF4998 domain-containing protein [Mucilaginibacter paludis]|uniref:DUF5013 domain-containing protein n=1 Tax=Mucilaginibacter paludis DSM 18603 TaxID=714943 RepID=H1YA22_9SPHI|nr:DUF4998 domain-containing protein [Mucilaginibacter paludis]EHQ25006.1 hypothetical protein Mucpa_0825 [Mucilaginibacter paludis DSM 18603]
MKQHQNIALYTIALLLLIAGACTKMDAYKDKYLKNGSIVYPGRMDSVKIFSGRNRVKVTGLFTSDPKIVKYRVFWNSRRDSVEVAIKRTSGVDTARVIISNLPEGLMSFEVRTYDAQGNISVPVDTAANVYGDLYQASITNRAIVDAAMQADGSALITWADVDKTSGIVNMEIKYADKFNKSHDTIVTSAIKGLTTTLPNFKPGNSISYSTAYVPTATAIDKFNTAYQTHSVKAEITSIYLSNTGPFTPAANTGRWGVLGAPWITNAAAMNKSGGTIGGYSSDVGGVINWETWDNTPVVNGIVYQATSSPLPAGNYMVMFDEYSEVQSNSSVYCVAAAGGGGIPVLANLSTALGYVSLFNGATVGKTSPNVSDTRSFNFTLTAPQVVSIGFLGNVVGSGNPGSYFQVKNIKLFQN